MHQRMCEDRSVRTQPDAGSDAVTHSHADLGAQSCADLDAHTEVRRSIRSHASTHL